MKRMIVQGCTTILIILLYVPLACAQIICLRNNDDCSRQNQTDLSLLSNQSIRNAALSTSHSTNEGNDANLIGAASGTGALRSLSSSPKADFTGPAAACLFGENPHGAGDAAYYIDPQTLSVAIYGAGSIRVYPVFSESIGFSSLKNLIYSCDGVSAQSMYPGFMFLGGICLIGLSGLSKRRYQTAGNVRHPHTAEGQRTSFEKFAMSEQLGTGA